jgi:outer membrane immunogenic protein
MRFPTLPLATATLLAFALPATVRATDDLHGWYAGLDVQQSRIEREAGTTLDGAWSIESNELRAFVAGLDAGERRASDTGVNAHLGYLHSAGERWLFGVELGLDGGGERVDAGQGPTALPGTPSLSYATQTALEFERTMSLRGLVGLRLGESQAVYASVGAARADVLATTGITSNGGYAKAGRFDGHRSSLQWGLGWRMALNERWSLRAEWLQADLGNVDIENAYLPGSSFTDPAYIERYRIELDTRQLRVGLGARF